MGEEVGSRCGHTFDPEQWETELPEVESDLESEWTCDRDPHPDADACLFHMSPEERDERGITDEDVVDRLRAEISKEGPESKRFVDATFGTVDLRDCVLSPPDNCTLDFRHATFEGKLLLGQATVTNDITFRGSEFEQVWMNGVRFEGEADWYGCEFAGTVKADNATFGGKALFARSRFRYGVRFRKSPTFEGNATFTGAFFESNLHVTGGTFESLAYFRDVDFHKANFSNTTFVESARFGDATFEERATFAEATFEGPTFFGRKDRDDDREAATFECPVDFADATVRSQIDFADVGLERQSGTDPVDESPAEVRFEGLACTGTLEFDPSFSEERTVRVDFTDARVDAGELGQPTRGTVVYDFRRATVGDVESTADTYDESALDAVRFVECDFDGFDFSRYRPALEPDYRIHALSGVPEASETDLSAVVEETTYQKAKSGADEMGDNRAASAFFVREMRARKRRLAGQIDDWTTTDGLTRKRRYVTNRFFDGIANYGESAGRVTAASGGIVGGYALLYGLWYTALGGEPYPDAPAPFNYLLLSLESFTGLVHGGGPTVDEWFVRLLAATEGFVGAFLIALFLFALTRSVHR